MWHCPMPTRTLPDLPAYPTGDPVTSWAARRIARSGFGPGSRSDLKTEVRRHRAWARFPQPMLERRLARLPGAQGGPLSIAATALAAATNSLAFAPRPLGRGCYAPPSLLQHQTPCLAGLHLSRWTYIRHVPNPPHTKPPFR